jgi:DNA sulfur modification protein DndB
MNKTELHLPCLRGQIGDWMFYVTIISLEEVANRVKLPKEIDKKYDEEKLKLGDWIQRKIENSRIKTIVNYLKHQEQRFFNGLILGIYDGSPTWQEINVQYSNKFNDESKLNYLSKTFGILNLKGDESIFAIDGQHRAFAIRQAVQEKEKLKSEEIAAIFLAHKATTDGKIRTRRLFSTLNKYAKPVSQSEIIALSEDNNCAVITRNLVDEFGLFKDKVLVIKNRSISPDNKTSFTNIMVLYDIVERILTDRPVVGLSVSGKSKNIFTSVRAENEEIIQATNDIKKLFNELVKKIPSFSDFFSGSEIDRTKKTTSLLFRPIGQNIFFNVLKVGISNSKKKIVIDYFANEEFNLTNKVWKKIFWDEETEIIITEKSRQRYATLLILEHLGFQVKRTKKDQENFENFKIDPLKI